MKTQQAIVSDSGWEAKPVNPYATSEKVYTEVYNLFDKNNPSRPLTKEHTPFEKVTVREVWQWMPSHMDEWLTAEPQDYVSFENIFEDFTDHCKTYGTKTRLAFEVVSEEEGKADMSEDDKYWNELIDEQDTEDDDNRTPHEEYLDAVISLRKKSVEEAAEKWHKQQTGFILEKKAGFIAGANHILQSGEYVKVSDVEKLLNQYVEKYQTSSLYVKIKQEANRFLTTLKKNDNGKDR